MNKVKVLVYKDEEGILRPNAFIFTMEGEIANYAQFDVDKFMKRMKGHGEVVRAEVIETKN